MSFKPRPTDYLGKVRRIIAAWPETSERLSHGSPTFWGGSKTFATVHNGSYDDGQPSLWFKAAPGAQEALVESDPVKFYRPKYLGPSGWVAIRLRPDTDWNEVRALLLSGYGLVAPKRAWKAMAASLG